MVSTNFLAQKTIGKKNIFSNFWFKEMSLKREIFVNLFPQKFMTKYGIVSTYSVNFVSQKILTCLQCIFDHIVSFFHLIKYFKNGQLIYITSTVNQLFWVAASMAICWDANHIHWLGTLIELPLPLQLFQVWMADPRITWILLFRGSPNVFLLSPQSLQFKLQNFEYYLLYIFLEGVKSILFFIWNPIPTSLTFLLFVLYLTTLPYNFIWPFML